MIVKYSATWCEPCKHLSKQLSDLGYALGLDYQERDIEEHAEEATAAGIRTIPTLVKYAEDGTIIERATGPFTSAKLYTLFAKDAENV